MRLRCLESNRRTSPNSNPSSSSSTPSTEQVSLTTRMRDQGAQATSPDRLPDLSLTPMSRQTPQRRDLLMNLTSTPSPILLPESAKTKPLKVKTH